jgi:YbbR domain-containing protein
MRVLLRNWHLKLGALALATILYTGLVFSGSFSEDTIQVPVDVVGQPGNSFLLDGDIGTVQVRYRVAQETASEVSADGFVATIDLSAYDLERAAEPQVLSVEVTSLIDGVTVLAADPATATVRLDRLEVRTVPVQVDSGEIPDGLELAGTSDVSPEEVQVRGPASHVVRVDRAVARVRIDPSGIDVERAVVLEPVDVEGQPVPDVEVTPDVASVQIDVQPVETNRTVSVRPVFSGIPAAGFALAGISVEPSSVTLRGLPEVLAGITEVLTEPLDIGGASAEQSFTAALVLEDGTRLADEDATPSVTVVAAIAPSVSSRTFVSGIVCEGAGSNACLPGFEQVSITLSGPDSLLAALTAEELVAVVDATGLAPGTHELTATLPALPDGVELLTIDPAVVPVTIRAASSPPPTPTPAP